MPLDILEHPLAAHLLGRLRNEKTDPEEFRRLSSSLTTLLVIHATRSIKTVPEAVRTPIESTEVLRLSQSIAAVPILRAGLGMLQPVLDLFPEVAVGYIGLERHHETAIASSYYCKLPSLSGCYTLCLDPMLATGGSASQAIHLLKEHGADQIVLVCVVAAPEGIGRLSKDHPDVLIVTAAQDRGLDEQKYIRPGLGDYGDRLFGTL